jgi:hypothetical protein
MEVTVEVEGKEGMGEGGEEARGKEVMAEGGEEGAIAATSFLATACISGEDHSYSIGPRTMESPGSGTLRLFCLFLKAPWQVIFLADYAGGVLYPYL